MRAILVAVLAAASCTSSSAPAPVARVEPQPPRTPAVTPGIEQPSVAPTGFDRADRTVPDVAVSLTALTVKGTPVATLVDGALAAGDVEGGAVGMIVPALRDAAARLPDRRLALSIDRRVPARTLVQVMTSLRAAGQDDLALLARAGAYQMSAPVMTDDVPADPDGVRLVVSLSANEVRLWSTSGREGTLAEPRLRMQTNPGIDLAQLSRTLAEIRANRGAGERSLLVMADGGVAVQRIAETISAVRATADGAPLYPDVRLALGVD